jgi:hypothetical protein
MAGCPQTPSLGNTVMRLRLHFDLADGKSVLRAALLDRRECGLKATTQGLLGGSVRNTVRQVMN